MTQQVFSLLKNPGEDTLYSISRFGSLMQHEAVAIQPNTKMEFKIFHGKGGTSMSFSVGTIPAKKIETTMARFYPGSDPHLVPLNIPHDISDNIIKHKTKAAFRMQDNYIPGGFDGPDIFGINEFDGGVVDPPSGGHWDQVAITVELFRPHDTEPLHVWECPVEVTSQFTRPFNYPITHDGDVVIFPPPEVWEKMKKDGWWRCVVTLNGDTPAYIHFRSSSFVKKVEAKEKLLTKRWLNHAFWNVLNVLAPKVSIEKDTVFIGVATELSNTLGREPFSIVEKHEEINSRMELTALTIEACRGKDVISFLKDKRDKTAAAIPNEHNPFKLLLLQKAYLKWKNKYEKALDEVENDDAAIKILPIFSNPTVSFDKYTIDGTIEFEEMPTIFIRFANFGTWLVQAHSEIEYTVKDLGFLESIAIEIGDWWNDTDYGEWLRNMNGKIESVIEKNDKLIKSFLYVALSKAVGELSVAEELHATSQGWVVKYYDSIVHPNPADPYFSVDLPDVDIEIENPPVSTGGVHTAGGPVVTGGVMHAAADATAAAFGPIPDNFKMGSIESLERLDQVETLIVIMMENRSFDHLLGDLARTYPSVGYTCFDPGFTNPPAGNIITPISPCKAVDVFFPEPRITPISPEHAYKHVMRQISDGNYDVEKPKKERDDTTLGLMQGFTTDIMARFEEMGGNSKYPHEIPQFESPQVVMTYYQKEQLPVYYSFARNYKVLDHWFAAHPGATWPNRIATHTGKLISLVNFDMVKEKRIAYFKTATVFDVLTEHDIDWVFLESNASIMRIFDKYRTDDKHVIPMHKSQTLTADKLDLNADDFYELDKILAKDKLPRVIFIEPRFSDAPPLKKAYDDLAPVNIGFGQDFIKTIYDKFKDSGHWDKCTMLVTYDEHGGFFDHVPPPGTPHSDHPLPVPAIYRDPFDPDNEKKFGPTNMGVRVPAFLISPFVKKGSVSHEIFDHTSILKTILVHNRNKIKPEKLISFGDRVNQAHHLGRALDRNTPRVPAAINVPNEVAKKTRSGKKTYYTDRNVINDDYHETLRRMFMPK